LRIPKHYSFLSFEERIKGLLTNMEQQREIILWLTSLLVVTILWVGFDIYHNASTSTISKPLQVDITEISPEFDSSVIQQLKSRQYIAPVYTFPAPMSVTPEPHTNSLLSGERIPVNSKP